MGLRIEDKEVQEGIEATIYAIRENLMAFFKGDCIQNLTTTNVSTMRVERGAVHNFERTQNRVEQISGLYIKSNLLLYMQHNQDRVKLFEATLTRGRVMRQIREGIMVCLEKYLPHVEVVHSADGVAYWRQDKQLVTQNTARRAQTEDNQTPAVDYYSYSFGREYTLQVDEDFYI